MPTLQECSVASPLRNVRGTGADTGRSELARTIGVLQCRCRRRRHHRHRILFVLSVAVPSPVPR